MGRAPCCNKEAVKKGSWSEDEDSLLRSWVEKNGCEKWQTVAELSGNEITLS